MADSEELSGRKNMVLFMLLQGNTQKEAAAACDLNEATVSRWMNGDAAFIAAYNSGLQSLYAGGLAELMEARRMAIGVLVELLEKPNPNRLKAVELTLKYSSKPEGPTNADEIDIELQGKELKRKNDKTWHNMGIG